jgi:hypothetical protein
MIRLQDLTPAVYYEQSRDFQLIGRLYDLVLNYVKTNAANLYNLPVGKNMDEQLLNLLALTLGFKPSKNYNSKQLQAICSVLPTILKHKGSIQALVIATNALLAAEGVKQPLDYTLHPKKGLTLYVAQELQNLNLLTDLLDYLLPAGISCNLVKETQKLGKAETNLEFSDTVTIYNKQTTDDGKIYYGTEDTLLSNIISELSLGQIGDTAGVLANVTVVKNPLPEQHFMPDPTTGPDNQSQNIPSGGEVTDEQ